MLYNFRLKIQNLLVIERSVANQLVKLYCIGDSNQWSDFKIHKVFNVPSRIAHPNTGSLELCTLNLKKTASSGNTLCWQSLVGLEKYPG